MQKPISLLKAQEGSALVGVVAFSIIMALAASGLLMVAGSGVNDEVEALANEKAFQAAESGLLIGTRYLRISAVSWPPSNGPIISSLSLNGFIVDVSVAIDAQGTWVVSKATGGKYLPYPKTVKWLVNKANAGAGTFVNNVGVTGNQQVGQGYFDNVVIDGPFHSNEPIVVSSVSDGAGPVAFVNGPVTVFNKLEKKNFDWKPKALTSKSGHWGNYGQGARNDYSYGVFAHNLEKKQNEDQGDAWDDTFRDDYHCCLDSLYVDDKESANIPLPGSFNDPLDPGGIGGDNNPAHRPTLEFLANGDAIYYTWNTSGTNWVVNADTLAYTTINNSRIRVPSSDVNILGKLKGQVTVETDPGYSIFPVGDLKYVGFIQGAYSGWDDTDPITGWENSTNYGIGMTNTNMLGLISGANLQFLTTWYDPRDLVKKPPANPPAKAVAPEDIVTKDLFFMANLIASEPLGTNRWQVTGGNIVASFKYNLRWIGGRTIDGWFDPTSGGNNNATGFKIFHDRRLSEIGLNAPKMPNIYAASNGVGGLRTLNLSDWTEENI